MKHRRPVYYGYSNRTIILTIALFCSLFFGLGYSLLGTSLGLNGDVSVSKYDQTLYGVLEKAAKKGTYAKSYDGNHQDSMNSSLSSKNIYHWYANNSTGGNEIKNKWNVIFANHCWQMYRTTDTGGVKLIYNGEAIDNKCLESRGDHVGYKSYGIQNVNSNYWYGTDYSYDSVNNVFSISGQTNQSTWSESNSSNLIGKYTCKGTTSSDTCSTLYLIESYNDQYRANVITIDANSHYSQFGTLHYNSSGSIGFLGYMYNTIYDYFRSSDKEKIYTYGYLNTNYWYADSISWDNSTGVYSLVNPYKVTSTADYASLVGKYTFKNSTQSYTSDTVQYIAVVDTTYSSYYYIDITDGNTISDYNYIYTYGSDYTNNGDGTFTIINPSTISRLDWYSNRSNLGNSNVFICKNAINNTCNNVWKLAENNTTEFGYTSIANNYKYAKSFTYNNGKYTLSGNTINYLNLRNDESRASLNNAHYTCFNTSGECSTIVYIYYAADYKINYLYLNNGENIDDAINKMLYADDVNKYSSIIKSGIEYWYKKNLYTYDNYIEDTIYCNNRTIYNKNGWNPDGGDVQEELTFPDDNSTDLSCPLVTDRFSISNNKAKLNYKVGLATKPEMRLFSQSSAHVTSKWYWLLTPDAEDVNGVSNSKVNYNGQIFGSYTYKDEGVRPVISLIPGTEYVSGTGSMADPYIVDAEPVVPEITQYRLLIRYWKDGVIYNTFDGTFNEGHTYNVATPNLDGYDVDLPRVTGTLNSDVTYDITYTPRPFTLTVRFIYQDGSQAAPPHTETHTCINESYSVELPVISGFTPSRPSPATGNMPCRNTPLTIIYLPNSGGS